MLRLAKICLFVLLAVLLLPIFPKPILAVNDAILVFDTDRIDYYVGEMIYIDIYAHPGTEPLNTVRSIMSYNGGDVIDIDDFDLNWDAGFNMSPGRVLDDVNNEINVGGFILVDTFSSPTLFGTLVFQAKQLGSSTITFDFGSHLISPDQEEQIDLPNCDPITINVIEPIVPPPPNNPPNFMSVGSKNIELGQTVSFSVSATDPDGDKVNFTPAWEIPVGAIFDNINQGGVTATGDFTWIPPATGNFTLRFYATDDHATDPKTATLSVNVNVSAPPAETNNPPIFQSVSNKSISLGDSVNFAVLATDPNDDNVTLTWEIPAGAGFSNVTTGITAAGDFSWTPTTEGITTLKFTATDDSPLGSKSSTLNVIVSVSVPQNHPPKFEPVAEKTVNAGEIITFNVSATDQDNDNVLLSMPLFETGDFTILTTGAASTGTFSWQAQNFGIYYVLFNALDDHPTNPLSATLSVRITVFGGECPPCAGDSSAGETTCPLPKCEEISFGQEIDLEAPFIESLSHPSQDIWYSNDSPQFIWEVKDEGDGFAFNLDENPFGEPVLGYYFSKEKAFSFSDADDGFWYFHIKTQYQDAWGKTGTYRIKIDTVPPDLFLPTIEKQQLADQIQYKLNFSAIDKHSGLAYFEMKIDDGEWVSVASPLILNDISSNGKKLILRAIDNAGNAIERYVDLSKYEIIEQEPEIYVIESKIPTISRPSIDHVVLPKKILGIFTENVIMLSGRAEPNSTVNVHLLTDPETVFATEANEDGIWLFFLNKELEAGKYGVFATATKGDLHSLPSEIVFISLQKKFTPQTYDDFIGKVTILVVGMLTTIVYLAFFNRGLMLKIKWLLRKKTW